jgi:hypothetical protein
LLTVVVGRIATALVVHRTGIYVGTKAESTTSYEAHVGDEWTDLVRNVYALCKQEWHYRLPGNSDDRQQLKTLCQRALQFENHFYTTYHDYLLKELSGQSNEGRLRAIERCGEIIFPGDRVQRALYQVRNTGDLETQKCVDKVINELEQHQHGAA